MPDSLACCAELAEKQPKAQGISTSAVSKRLVPRGHNNRLSAMLPMAISTVRAGPKRSILRVTHRLPKNPNAPNQANIRLS